MNQRRNIVLGMWEVGCEMSRATLPKPVHGKSGAVFEVLARVSTSEEPQSMSEPEWSAMSILSSIISSSDSDEETALLIRARDSGKGEATARAGVGRLETGRDGCGIRGVLSVWRTSG